jgi:hypothetical protein
MKVVTDPPATMDSDSLTSEVQLHWRRRQIGRPGKEDRAMDSPTLESAKKIRILFFETSREDRRACGVSLWSERKTKSSQLSELASERTKTRKLLVGGGGCYEAETQIVRFGDHRPFTAVRMSTNSNFMQIRSKS